MFSIGHAVISDDVAERFFVCDLLKCKGACCVEGDLGAPLTSEELTTLEEVYDKVEPYLSERGKKEIEKQGLYITDEEGDFSTPTVDGLECAYAIYDKKGILKCGIEQAYRDGKIKWQKPISCHLYPIRITRYDNYEAVNYDRWHICNPACNHGKELGVELYKFLKEPLIRKYGHLWYLELEQQIEERRR
ncbi:MAG: DUF3109 family protein [Cytophagaceae bacterium]|jgi:hypothetical protein|nr:DUF3109 family protein [Cytophagaceae bacterium]